MSASFVATSFLTQVLNMIQEPAGQHSGIQKQILLKNQPTRVMEWYELK